MEVIENKLDEALVRRAVVALLRHVKRSEANKHGNLLEDEGDAISVQLALHKIPGDGAVTAKPIPIPIPHPLRHREQCDMCMFVKDDSKGWIKEMMEKEPVDGLKKVRPWISLCALSCDRYSVPASVDWR